MEVKTEPIDSEMCEKCEKLQKDYAKLEKEMAQMRKEMSEMRKENAKLKAQNQQKDLESRQSQMSMMMDNSPNSTFDDLPTNRTEQNNEFTAETMIMDVRLDRQQQSQNLANFVDSMENANTIKREYENAKMRANSQFQMETTSSALNNEEEDEGDERNGLQVYENFVAHNDGGLIAKNELDEESGRSISADAMDFEDEEEENGTSENVKNGGIDGGQIKYAPIKNGKILKCNWPGCKYQAKNYNNNNMQKHWRVHTGERPYVCEECGQSFKQSSALKRHERTHMGVKPYHCDMCEKSFRQNSDLSRHRRTHTGERPYVCEECGQSFKQSRSLKEHKRMHNKRWNNNRKN